MRVRKKSWAQNELDTNTRLVMPHNANRGRWSEYFGNDHEIYAEIGCGMGRWVTQSAALFPDVNFVALERQKHVIVSGMRKSREFEPKPAFVVCDANDILDIFASGELSRIYINFCDPWRRPRWFKRRLTYRGFLEKYKAILCPSGGLFFKTDNMPLFDFSLSEFRSSGWRLENVTRDLHGSCQGDGSLDNARVVEGTDSPATLPLMTEYEEKFFLNGMPIFRCEAYI